MNAVFLDTGVLLRILHADDPLHATVRTALVALRRQRCTFFTSFQNVAEFWNVSTRPASARGGFGLDAATVKRRVEAINRWCQVLVETESSYAIWMRLVDVRRVQGAAVHDARLVSTMLARGIPHVLTLNDQDFRRYEQDGIVIATPQSIVAATE